MMRERNLYRLNGIILTLIFCFFIFTPFIGGLIQQDKQVSNVEKRNLNPLPSMPASVAEFINFPRQFNLYYADHFGLREKLTKKYFKMINKLNGKSSVDDVTTGKDGWLFLGSIRPGYKRFNDPFGDVTNVNLYSVAELEEFSRSITRLKNWLAQQGIQYIFIITPNKHTIYFDKLPEHIKKQNSESATDQLISYLRQHTDVKLVDLRSALFKAKNKQQLYFKYDTHWNHYGANIAQNEILKGIKTFFPEQIKPVLLMPEQFNLLTKTDSDLAAFAKITGAQDIDPRPTFNRSCSIVDKKAKIKLTDTFTMRCDANNLTALVFRDSFFTALEPYISRSFKRSTYIWHRINYQSLSKHIERDKPDIVIDEVIERTLPYLPELDN